MYFRFNKGAWKWEMKQIFLLDRFLARKMKKIYYKTNIIRIRSKNEEKKGVRRERKGTRGDFDVLELEPQKAARETAIAGEILHNNSFHRFITTQYTYYR